MNMNKRTNVKVVSSSTVKSPGRNLEVKHSTEYEILASELEEKKEAGSILSKRYGVQSPALIREGPEVQGPDEVQINLFRNWMLDAEPKAKVEGIHLKIM